MTLQKFFINIIKILCVCCFSLLTVSLALMILSRGVSFINFDVMWTDEIGRYLLVYLVFLGSGLGMIENRHISVNYFLEKMPPKMKHFFSLFNNVITILFCIIMIWGGGVLVKSTTTQAVATLRKYFFMPMAYWNSAVMVSGVIMLISVSINTFRILRFSDFQASNNREDEV